ncbi:MAG: restriction endonuclease subunit S [Pseudomonadota bacterium]|nr:restriction endonuclease subunit S [Pseudomonadota bacterium]
MASDWTLKKIGEFAEVKGGKRLPKGKRLSEKKTTHPYIRVVDFTEGRISLSNLLYVPEEVFPNIKRYIVESGDVVISIVGTIGLIATIPSELHAANLTENAAKILIEDTTVDSQYLSYYLKSSIGQHEIQRNTVGSTQPKLPLYGIKNIEVSYPRLPEQRAIAHILGSLDDKIELNRRMNQTLEATARATFKSWFVDFVPVRAKAEGRPTGLPDDIAALFPDSFEGSEIGEIPKGWRVGVVSDLGNVICGKTPPTKDPENYGEDIPFITIPDMHGKVFVTQTGKYLSTKGANTQRNKYLPAKTICVSCIATPGLVVMTTKRSQTNQQINSVIPKSKRSSYYCYQVLNRLGDQIRAGGSGGSVLLNLNKTLFSNIKVLIPDSETIESYQQIVEPFFERLLQNQRESVFLSSLRDTLLPKLISGELRVPDAEKFVEEAGV